MVRSEDDGAGDVAIIGAGLIGLAVAVACAKRGARVTVYDSREPARAASWAGAGMLAPFSEETDGDFAALCAASLDAYPAFVDELRALTGIDAGLRRDGTLHVAYDPDDVHELEMNAARLRAAGVVHELLDRRATLEREPILGIATQASLALSGEAQVDNRRLGRALLAACDRLRIRVIASAIPIAVEADRRVRGLRTADGFVAAPVVVNAAGAWAGQLDGVPPQARVPVSPVAGQMLAISLPRTLVRHVVWARGVYLVPRSDGRLLIGATVERRGFDARVTAAGIAWLLRGALETAPSLGDFTVSETWAGVRPGTPDGLPYLGATAIDGYFVAAGHYRNGILLAPITAEILADAIEEKSPQRNLAPFAAARATDTEPAPGLANLMEG